MQDADAQAAARQFDVLGAEFDSDRSPTESLGNREGGPRAGEGIQHRGWDRIRGALAIRLPGLTAGEAHQSLAEARALATALQRTGIVGRAVSGVEVPRANATPPGAATHWTAAGRARPGEDAGLDQALRESGEVGVVVALRRKGPNRALGPTTPNCRFISLRTGTFIACRLAHCLGVVEVARLLCQQK